jgi:hypothetical protein
MVRKFYLCLKPFLHKEYHLKQHSKAIQIFLLILHRNILYPIHAKKKPKSFHPKNNLIISKRPTMISIYSFPHS